MTDPGQSTRDDVHPGRPGLHDLARSINRRRFRYSSEAQLQAALADALTADGYLVLREAPLGGGRIDLLVGRIGIEVKVAGSRAPVLRQLRRYADPTRLDGLVLVTTRARQLAMPADVGGIPLEVVELITGAL
jgi:hypothetical protein